MSTLDGDAGRPRENIMKQVETGRVALVGGMDLTIFARKWRPDPRSGGKLNIIRGLWAKGTGMTEKNAAANRLCSSSCTWAAAEERQGDARLIKQARFLPSDLDIDHLVQLARLFVELKDRKHEAKHIQRDDGRLRGRV